MIRSSLFLAALVGLTTGCEEQGTESKVPDDVARRAAEVSEWSAQCQTADADACVRVAWAHTTGRDMPVDLDRAVEFHRLGCAAEDSRGCMGLALHQWRGEGGLAADPEAARELQIRACELGSAYACRVVAEALHLGVYLPRSRKKARKYLAKACEAGDTAACDARRSIFEDDLEELQREPIRAVIREMLPDLRNCSERAKRRDAEARGRVTVDFEVGCDGYVRRVSLAESTFSDPEEIVAACVTRMVSGWEFSPPMGGAGIEFHYPFSFGP